MTSERDLVDISFERVAERYSGRIPYLPEFIAEVAKAFGLSKSSTVLDLGCGTGTLSRGFAPYCQTVFGVDRSEAMLAHRGDTPPNVRFLQADLNAENTTLPVRADLVVIGMAIQFFDKDKLIRLLDTVTAPSASVFVCGTTIAKETPWFDKYLKLRTGYSAPRASLDIYGQACFSGTPWTLGRKLRASAQRRLSTRDLIDNALSYPNLSEGILKNKEDFERRLHALLTPYYATPDHVVGEVVSWGLEYRRS